MSVSQISRASVTAAALLAIGFIFGLMIGRLTTLFAPVEIASLTGAESKPKPMVSVRDLPGRTTAAEWSVSEDPPVTIEASADTAQTMAADEDSDAVERCARRYASFDPADGTYQPYDRPGRVRCRFLR